MRSSTLLKPQSHLSKFTYLTNPSANPSFPIPINTISCLKPPLHGCPSHSPSRITTNTRRTLGFPAETNHVDKPLIRESKRKLLQDFAEGHSRFVLLGAMSVGFVLLFMGMDEQKALALGPEGPLVEEFWENMRRYALYALTVSTGALYTIFQPIIELLKNPISAVLVVVIFGGSLFIVSQVLSAMVGVTEFSYDYGY